MPYKPPTSFVPGVRADAAGADDDSLFWKTMEIIGRPSSAAFGVVTALQEGDDPFARAMKAIRGEADYRGADVLTNLGADPEHWGTKAAGFVMDVLNPLDPLTYVGGLGAVTKAGRAARLLGKGAANWADAARAGERGLLTFAGHRVPVPGDAAVLGAMQKAGQAIMGTELGRGLQTLFGGKRGAALAAGARGDGFDTEHIRKIFEAQDEAERLGNTFAMQVEPELASLRALRGEDKGRLLESIGLAYRGDTDWDSAAADYVRRGEAGADVRQAAWDAVHGFMRKRKDFTGRLDNTGIDAFAQPIAGYFPRTAYSKGTVGEAESLGDKLYQEQLAALQGPSNNAINKLLVPSGVEPVAVNTLLDEGRLEFERLGGKQAFDALERSDPQFVVEFLRKYRMTPDELNRIESMPVRYETDPAIVFQRMRDEAVQNVKGDELVKSLERAGLAQPWNDTLHNVTGEDGRRLFAKVDQGRWAENPIAVPWEYSRALQKMIETMSPGPDKAALGAMLNQALPTMLKDAGLMQWWKALAIFGGGPSYFSRNFFTGVIKNYYEGLGVGNPQTYRFYPAAFRIIGHALRGEWDNATINLGGVDVPLQRLYQEYLVRGMSGGGLPDVDIVQGVGKSAELRRKVFRGPQKINEQVEMAIRLPLMMKQIEDTFSVARHAGVDVQGALTPLASAGELAVPTADDIFERAFQNASRQVKLSHFDYTDMSPFEDSLRRFWIPFYSWMRKNIPHETVNMLQNPGKYMPFVRAYVEAMQTAGMTPQDMPEWMQATLALPVGQTDDGRNRFLDLTGFAPFMDVAELGNTLVGEPRTGEGRLSTIGRYLATRGNPFLAEFAEQSLQKEFLTGRSFGELPQEMFGVTVSPQTAGITGLLRPVRELDRLNPGSVFTQFGNALGTFEGDVRPRRNEPDEPERWLRFGTGIKFYGADPHQANLSKNEREKRARRLMRMAMSARREGRAGEAQYLQSLAESLAG